MLCTPARGGTCAAMVIRGGGAPVYVIGLRIMRQATASMKIGYIREVIGMLRLSRVNIFTGQSEAKILDCTQADVMAVVLLNFIVSCSYRG